VGGGGGSRGGGGQHNKNQEKTPPPPGKEGRKLKGEGGDKPTHNLLKLMGSYSGKILEP